MPKYFFLTGLLFILFACDEQRVFEKNIDLAGNQWYIDTIPSFSFRIDHPNRRYNIYYDIRNAVSYPYYNLFVTYYLQDSTGKQLASHLQELTLADATTGKPLGEGEGIKDKSIFDHQIASLKNYKFDRAGTYVFKVKQYMRQDPLPGNCKRGCSGGIRRVKAGKEMFRRGLPAAPKTNIHPLG